MKVSKKYETEKKEKRTAYCVAEFWTVRINNNTT